MTWQNNCFIMVEVHEVDDRNLQPIRPEGEPASSQGEMFSILFGGDISQNLSNEQRTKVDTFEKGLAQELNGSDSIDEAVTKMVRMALAVEFGAAMTRAKGAKKMIETIVSGILQDSTLRKQSLLIMDRYAGDDLKASPSLSSTELH